MKALLTCGYDWSGTVYGPGDAVDIPSDLAEALRERDVLVVVKDNDEAIPAPLVEAGFTSAEDVRNASDDDLLAVPGVGPATLKRVRETL